MTDSNPTNKSRNANSIFITVAVLFFSTLVLYERLVHYQYIFEMNQARCMWYGSETLDVVHSMLTILRPLQLTFFLLWVILFVLLARKKSWWGALTVLLIGLSINVVGSLFLGSIQVELCGNVPISLPPP
jgi:hypothetical protein